MNKITIREASVEDISRIMEIRMAVKENMLADPNAVTADDCLEYMTRRGKGWVAEANGVVAGFAIADLQEQNVWALFVHPDTEGLGIGRELHDTMLAWYFAQNQAYMWLSTDPGTRAEKFYESRGWRRTGTRTNGEVKFEMTREDWKC